MVQRVQSLRSSVKNTRPAQGTREPGELYVSFPDLQLGVIDTAKAPKDLIAVRFFSNLTDYAIGDFVINGGTGYRAKVAITAGAFNAANWDTIATTQNSEPPIAAGTVSQYWRGDKSWQLLDKAAVGLGNVDDTSDVNKPISSATQTALNLKAPIASPALTGTPTAPTPAAGLVNTQIATTAFVSAALSADVTTWGELTGVPATFPPTLPIPSSGVTGLDAEQDAQDAAIAAKVGPDAPTDGLTYGRKNATWATIVGGAVIADTPPAGPLQSGQLWWQSSTGNTYLWFDDGDTAQWVQQNVQPAPVPGSPPIGTIVRKVLTGAGAGNYVKPVGLKYLEVELVGGGGGASFTTATAAGQSAAAGGGGGGGYCCTLYAASALADTTPYTIGNNGNPNGGDATATTWLGMSAGGGQSGSQTSNGTSLVAGTGGPGGVATGGQINVDGARGGIGIRAAHGNATVAMSGTGGGNFFVASSGQKGLTSGQSAGIAGRFPGGGAEGTTSGPSMGPIAGANGAEGAIFLKEYF